MNNVIKTKLWSPNIGAMKKEARGLRPIRSKFGGIGPKLGLSGVLSFMIIPPVSPA